MKSETFKHLDGNDQEVERTYYFNLTPTEMAEWASNYPGGDLGAYLQKIGEVQNYQQMLKALRDVISRSVGERTPSGRFIKDPEFVLEFMSGDAYSSLVIAFCQDEARLLKFIKGIFPKDVVDNFTKKREYTETELLAMDDDEFFGHVGRDENKWSKETLLIAFKRRSQQGRAA